MVEVCTVGTGAMKPFPGRWVASLYICCNGYGILTDCGEGTQIALAESHISIHKIDTICLTHFHGDHVLGLPGLLMSMGNSDRKEPVTIMGPVGLRDIVKGLLVTTDWLPFEIKLVEFNTEEGSLKAGPYIIEFFKVKHRVPCYSYRFRIPRAGKFEPEKALSNNVPKKYWSRLQKGEKIEGYNQSMILGPERKGISIVYSTDTEPVSIIAEYAREADLFISEGTYGDEEKIQKAMEHGHMTFCQAAELGRKAEAKRMWLTHFSPAMLHPEEYIEKAELIFHGIEPATDGKKISLDFE